MIANALHICLHERIMSGRDMQIHPAGCCQSPAEHRLFADQVQRRQEHFRLQYSALVALLQKPQACSSDSVPGMFRGGSGD